mgnify:CR=1 FL=1
MSYTNEILKLRLPTGRPLTPKEHDENWSKVQTMFDRILTEFDIRMPPPKSPVTGNPTGTAHMIMAFTGKTSDIPDGWQLSDGTNGTINMVYKFIVGSDGSTFSGSSGAYSIGESGGQHTTPNHVHSNPDVNGAELLPTDIPELSFTADSNYEQEGGSGTNINTSRGGGTRHTTYSTPSGTVNSGGGTTQHVHTQGNTNPGGGHDNRPSYYALCFIAFVGKAHS